MYIIDFKNSGIKLFLLFFVYSVIVLFFVSPDSYLYDLSGRCDSAFFYMCGKSWMNGMLPYSDFADSKGPLLWLIYGVGYLLHGTSFVGVYWISCLFYASTLFFCYKTAYLLTGSKRDALLTAFLMVIPYFLYLFHYEIRAEDFCQPFIMGSLYFLLKLILQPSENVFRQAGSMIGIGVMSCLLIKWSLAAMLLGVLASGCIVSFQRQRFKTFFLYGLLGMLFVSLPFILYFVVNDILGIFIQEYFINTVRTVQSFNSFVIYICEWIYSFRSIRGIYLIYLLAILVYYRKHPEITIFPFLCGLLFFAISIHHDFGYYLNAVSSFSIFLVILIVPYINRRNLILVLFLGIFLFSKHMSRFDNLFYDKAKRKSYYEACYVMSQVNNPTVINEYLEHGIGVPVNALPATRYWAKQNGATPEMIADRLKAVREGQSDFIFCDDSQEENIHKEFLEAVKLGGYVHYVDLDEYEVGRSLSLYGKPGLKLPPENFCVSDADVFFKRFVWDVK